MERSAGKNPDPGSATVGLYRGHRVSELDKALLLSGRDPEWMSSVEREANYDQVIAFFKRTIEPS